MPILTQAIQLVSTQPGNLAYHLVLVFALGMAANISLARRLRVQQPSSGRMALGTGGMFLGRLVLMLAAGLASQGYASSSIILPPLDRAVAAASICLLIWAVAFPDRRRLADLALGSALFLILLGAVISIIQWEPLAEAGEFYNAQIQETVWESVKITLLVLGVLTVLLRRPPEWGMGVALLLILIVGHLVHLISPLPNASLPGAERLAELAAIPLLTLLALRRVTALAPLPLEPIREPASGHEEAPVEIPAGPEDIPRARHAADPRALVELAGLAAHTDLHNLCQAVSSSVGRALLADVCLLLNPPDADGNISIACGFDLIREIHLPGAPLNTGKLPTLTSAMRRGRPVRLQAARHATDLATLGQPLGLTRIGPALVAPLAREDHQTGAIVLLSPHAQREWTTEDQNLLTSLAATMSEIFSRAGRMASLEQAADHAREEAAEAARREALARQNADELSGALDEAERQLSREREQAQSIAALVSQQSETETELQAEIDRLRRQLEAASAAPVTRPAGAEDPESALKRALEEMARLNARLAEADEENLHLKETLAAAGGEASATALESPQREPAQPAQIDERDRESLEPRENLFQAEVIASLTQDLRQPMSSILGYTDLLLGESVGILGALQRKFLERVRASTERMHTLLDDLIRVTAIDSGTLSLSPEAVDVMSVIDDAFMSAGSQFREKGILLRMDIPDDLPPVTADRDAIYQIISHLLANASAASRQDGEVVLTARRERAGEDSTEDNAPGENDYLLLSVRDSGSGIAPEDLPRVFTRMYRADNPLIEGLGDTGVGLSIVRTLVDAHGGRIWIDSEKDQGSTISILLPIAGHAGSDQQGGAANG